MQVSIALSLLLQLSAMALSARHKWMAEAACIALGREAQQNQLEDMFRERAISKKLQDFLEGSSEYRHVCVLYQKTDVVTESGELLDGPGEANFIISFGEKERLKSKGVFFLRPLGKAVKLDSATGDDLLFGELAPNPLESLDATLARIFLPYLSQASVEQWGRCGSDQKDEFLQALGIFSEELSDAIRAMHSAVILPSCAEVEGLLVSGKSVSAADVLRSAPLETLHVIEGLLESWSGLVEKTLSGDIPLSARDGVDVGPKAELVHWRARLQRATGLAEQLKTPESKLVIGVMYAATRLSPDTVSKTRSSAFSAVRRWKAVELNLSEALNEASDNVKYLTTLDKFLEPLYSGNPVSIVESLPALMNSIKMIHTIARYYNTPQCMTALFTKITTQMITNCRNYLLSGGNGDQLWEQSPSVLLDRLKECLSLHSAYVTQYRETKARLESTPKGKQFDFSETQIFGRFDLFARRVHKLVDLFATVTQFRALARHRFDGMDPLVESFKAVTEEFKAKRHELLDYTNNRFDRDYVEFNLRIVELEKGLQEFVNRAFENISNISTSLDLLRKFEAILKRDSLKAELEAKYGLIFHNYGLELAQVQDEYEKCKVSPPVVRNLPPVTGNITWARHLLRRIEEPMQQFQKSPSVLQSKDARKIIRMFNKLAKTLVEFEMLWYHAWVGAVETAKSGLQAPLVVRLPEDDKLYVNLDPELLQLIRETKCLERLGLEIPDTAKTVLLQEAKFKRYHNELTFLFKEYRRVQSSVKPAVVPLLKPHFANMESVLQPGMYALTWTSLNIDSYLEKSWAELGRLEQLTKKVADLMENRIEANLKIVARTLLVSLPGEKQTVSLDDFVDMQEEHVKAVTENLMSKSAEIESAVHDLLMAVAAYTLEGSVGRVSDSEIVKLKAHYNWALYQSLTNATKRSLQILKNRMSARAPAGIEAAERPGALFSTSLQLDGISVRLAPSVGEVESAVTEGAVAIMKCSKMIEAWDTMSVPACVQVILRPDKEPTVSGAGPQGTFYDRIAQDKEILKSVLLLTGAVQNSRDEVTSYLERFSEFAWLWKENAETAYSAFMKGSPTLDEFEKKLSGFSVLQESLGKMDWDTQISALSIKGEGLKKALRDLANEWKIRFSNELHKEVKQKLDTVTERIKQTMKRLVRPVEDGDIDALGSVMATLQEVRKQQSEIEIDFIPITHTYAILDQYLPPNVIDKDEQDARSMLNSNWAKLLEESQKRQSFLSTKQVEYKSVLEATIQNFRKDVKDFRKAYEERGPMVVGLAPKEAVERLKRFKEEYEVRARKQEIYYRGEDLFGLNHQQYPQLEATKKELAYLAQLYDLYTQVLETIKEWKEYLWTEVPGHVEVMKQQVDTFTNRFKKMPKQLRGWPAYLELKKVLEDFTEALPLLMELAKKSVQPRHWQQVMTLTGKDLPVESDMFKLQSLIDANIVAFREDISDVCESADKQLVIEQKIADVQSVWAAVAFDFNTWKQRDYPCVLAGGRVAELQEQLEETMMALNTMNAMRHSVPFKEQLGSLLANLSDTGDTIERWVKVQMLWTSLESVFTGGDIAKQMPLEAKKFNQIDKDWLKIMAKSAETRLVINCCQNDMLKQLLPVLGEGLEACQKSLESYLEGKRNKFPRFYFVSDPVLLKILSQGSDPENVQDDFEKLFDAISRVVFDKNDKRKIVKIKAISGTAEEVLDLGTPVSAVGNIESWLLQLESEMQKAVRRECRACSATTGSVLNGMTLKEFSDKYIGQVALLGVQLVWTADFQEALMKMSREKDRAVMAATGKKFQQMLTDLVGICLTDLGSKMNRTKYETLITIHVHQRDLFSEVWKKVKEHKVKDETDFEWLKQTRFYWRTDTDHAIVSIADVDFTYFYEYLGVKERLVITPLTDRCYITQSQALGMYYGGAPAGPAGTGKTETTKDMGRTIGQYVIVTNCSDQHRFRDMAKIFKGLAMGALWGCFDEFNRIELEVLSVVAMQVEAISLAKKQNLKFFTFPGEAVPIRLMPGCAYFITMNPGYAGRQE